MSLFEPVSSQLLFENRGALEESLLNTSKLLESLDQNSRFDDVSEYNYLLTGMEGLLGQFSDNHHELHHEIKEIMESSRMGLLTHEKLVEMVTAEQLRSQYLNNIVGSLKFQIEHLFTTILTAVENRNGNDPDELLDKVSTDVNLMWKSVESMSKVISSPTKRLDQTIRKIDSEVVVHLNKAVQQNDGKKDGFAEKLDKRAQKAKINEEKRRHKLLDENESTPNSARLDRDQSLKNSSKIGRDNDSFGKQQKGNSDVGLSYNRHGDPHHTDSQLLKGDKNYNSQNHSSSEKWLAKSNSSKNNDDEVGASSKLKENNHNNQEKLGIPTADNGSMVFDDNISLGAASRMDSFDNLQRADSIDDDKGTESGRSSSHHKKHHKKSSRKDRKATDGSDSHTDDPNSARDSPRPSFDDASELSKGSKHKRRLSRDKRPGSVSDTNDVTHEILNNRLEEEKKKWERERLEWQKAYDARTLIDTQRTIYSTMIPMLDLHSIDTEEYQKILHSLSRDSDPQTLVAIANKLAAQQQQQLGSGKAAPSSRNNATVSGITATTNTYTSDIGATNTSSLPGATVPPSGLPHASSASNVVDGKLSRTPVSGSEEVTQFWAVMDADQRTLLLALSTSILASSANASNSNGKKPIEKVQNGVTTDGNPANGSSATQQLSVADQERLVHFLQDQLFHWSRVLSDGTDGRKKSNSERQGRPKLRRTSSNQLGISSRSPSTSSHRNVHSDDDTCSLDSRGEPRRKRKSSVSPSHSPMKPSSPKNSSNNSNSKKSTNKLQQSSNNNPHAHSQQHAMNLTVQGKKTQKPITQFLDEQAYHIGQLVRSHLQREGIHDLAYYGVVTDFIQHVLVNAAKQHGDSGLKQGNTEQLSKNLEFIKISLPDKYKEHAHSKTSELGINTDLVMIQSGNNSSNGGGGGMAVRGNAVMTTTTTVKTVMVNGAPVQQQQQVISNDNANGNGPNGWELPVFDNQENILITRTYRPPEKKAEFLELLQQHTDPIQFLYEEFQPYLSKQDRLRLYFACLNTKDRIEETKLEHNVVHAPDRWMKTIELVQDLRRSVLLLDDETKAMSVIMLDLENIVHEAVAVVKNARRQGKMRAINVPPPSHRSNNNHSPGGVWSETQGLPFAAGNLPHFDDDLLDDELPGADPNHRPLSTGSRPTASASMKKKAHKKYTIDDESIRLMESHLFDIQRLLGEMEARVVSANLQQLEYRAFFQTLQASGHMELPNMLKEFQEIHQSFIASQEIQGRLYEVQQRLLLCQDRCFRYNLFDYIPPQFAYYGRNTTASSNNNNASSRITSASSFFDETATASTKADKGNTSSAASKTATKPNSLQELLAASNIRIQNKHDPQTAALLRLIEDLQEDMQALEEEKEDIELEMMEVVKSKDRTPDAILFFSLMHDPSFVPNLQQFCLQMKQIRGFLDYSVHMDYVMLRKRLQVCMVLTPNIEKLVDKYALMYKQWSHFRRNWFAERNLRGGSAESFTTCPLCYHSLVEGNAPVASSDHGKESAKQAQKKTKGRISGTTTAAGTTGAVNTTTIGGGLIDAAVDGNNRTIMMSDGTMMVMSKQHGRAAASAAARQDEVMLAAPSTKLMVGGGVISSTSSMASNGSRRVSHSISLPAISSQR